jgi:benzodiazapine receptor
MRSRSGRRAGLARAPSGDGDLVHPLILTLCQSGDRWPPGGPERRAFLRTYALDLALSTAWTPLFFRARAPVVALADVVALSVLNAHLLRRAWRVDRPAAAILAPYVAWTYATTALNTAIVHRNAWRRR